VTYQDSARNLSSVDKVDTHLHYVPLWIPLDENEMYYAENDSKPLSLSLTDLEKCAQDLDVPKANNPVAEVRTIHIIECMNKKGWQPFVDVVLIME